MIRLVIHHFFTPFNPTPIESILKLIKVWTRLQIHMRSRASTKLAPIAATNVHESCSSQTSTGMTPTLPLERVALGLAQRLVLRILRCRRWYRSVKAWCQSGLLTILMMLAINIDHLPCIHGAAHQLKANHEALLGD